LAYLDIDSGFCKLAAYWRVSSAFSCGILQEMSVEDFGAQQKFIEALLGIWPFAVESRSAQFLKDAGRASPHFVEIGKSEG
jgi:hypothetical protein